MKPVCRYPVYTGCVLMALMLFSAQTQAGTNDASKPAGSVERDPFWPVGFRPEQIHSSAQTDPQRALKSSNGNEDWSAAMKLVDINGVSSRGNNEFFAVINGQIKRIGENVSVSCNGMFYTWVVVGIKPPGSVKLRRISVK